MTTNKARPKSRAKGKHFCGYRPGRAMASAEYLTCGMNVHNRYKEAKCYGVHKDTGLIHAMKTTAASATPCQWMIRFKARRTLFRPVLRTRTSPSGRKWGIEIEFRIPLGQGNVLSGPVRCN